MRGDVWLTSRVARHTWHGVVCPFAHGPIAVLNRPGHLINIRCPGQLSLLFNRRNLTIRRCHRNGPCNRLIQIAFADPIWVSLSWIIRQLISRRLWRIRRDCHVSVFNRHGDGWIARSRKGQFRWEAGPSDQLPTGRDFIWYFNHLIGLTTNGRCVDGIPFLVHVVNVGRLRVRRVDQLNGDRVLSVIKVRRRRSNFLRCHVGLRTGVTWHISRWYARKTLTRHWLPRYSSGG